MKNWIRNLFAVGIILIISYWAVKPLVGSGYFPMHDDTQIGRVVGMGKALRHGQFPVRIISDLGYGFGYPIFNYYAPLPYYFGGVFYALGLSGITSAKIMFITGILLSAVAMFIFLYRILGLIPATIASLFYIYAPYHAVQIYVRGAVGEYWYLVFLPLIVCSILNIIQNQKKQGVILGGLALSGAILAHTILGYLSVVILGFGLIGLFIAKKYTSVSSKIIYNLFLMTVLGLGFSAFYWLPAITEIRFTSVSDFIWDQVNYRDHFVCLNQLYNSLWGYGGSAPGCIDGISFKLGKLQLFTALLAILFFFIRFKAKKPFIVNLLFYIFLGIFIFSAFMMLKVSVPIWEILPFSGYIQYPWRFLNLAIFSMAGLSAYFVYFLRNNRFLYIGSTIALLAILLLISIKIFRPQYTYFKNPQEFEDKTELMWRVSKISDEYLPAEFTRPAGINDIAHDTIITSSDLNFSPEVVSETYLKIGIVSAQGTDILINRAYIPGWHYFVNGTEVKPKVKSGLPVISVPKDFSTVELKYVNTPIRTIANLITVITALLSLYFYAKKTIS